MTTSEIRKAKWPASFALFVAPSESSRSLIGLVCGLGADVGQSTPWQFCVWFLAFFPLWQETAIRRKERINHGERDDLRQQWAECKRRLGSTGRNNKNKLIPSWTSVSQPLALV